MIGMLGDGGGGGGGGRGTFILFLFFHFMLFFFFFFFRSCPGNVRVATSTSPYIWHPRRHVKLGDWQGKLPTKKLRAKKKGS